MSLRKFILIISLGFLFFGGHSLYKSVVTLRALQKFTMAFHDRVFNSTIPIYTYKLITSYKQPSSDWFVQGIYYYNNEIYESVGIWGISKLVKWRLKDAQIIKLLRLEKKYFAEDITILKGKLYQLTYDTNIAFVYDLDSLEKIGSFKYNTNGWGLTNDGKHLIRSDGSSKIYFIDPNTYQLEKTINVHDKIGSVTNINAMDYINGKIYANIYLTPFIAEISPDNGGISAWISLEGLNDKEYDLVKYHVPNGITHTGNDLLVSGKNWSAIYQISLREP
jgi:glutaminyl-peptide cyclotransferase